MDSKRTNVEAAMTINGLHTTERQAWRKKSDADAAWVETNGNLWRAILTAMRDNGAVIRAAWCGEDGWDLHELFIAGKKVCDVSGSDFSEYNGCFHEYRDGDDGFHTFSWCERTAQLLAELAADTEAAK